MGNIFSQSLFIPEPTLTEKNLPDQADKVHIVTGGYLGCGFELAKIFYQKNAVVYIAGRSKEKADKAIATMKQLYPDSKGRIEFMQVDLANLATIKPAAEEFIEKESRLDTLTNNAGVMAPPVGSQDAHGHEQQIGTNCLGPWLLTQCLLPHLLKTASNAPADSVRVTWAASIAVWLSPSHGVQFDATGAPICHNSKDKDYAQSKAANILLAAEYARRYGKEGLVSVSWNPGNLKTELLRHGNFIQKFFLETFILFPAVYGAYTELYAACSPDIGQSQNGAFIAPWGRIYDIRADVAAAMKSKEDNGTGESEKLWKWCEKEAKEFI